MGVLKLLKGLLSSALMYRGKKSFHFPSINSVLLSLSLVALSLLLHLYTNSSSDKRSLAHLYFPGPKQCQKRPFENVPVSLSHIVLSLILQAHCQRRLCAHPRGDGSAEGPGGHQPVTVRRQLPEWRQPDPPSARQNQVRGRDRRGQRVTLNLDAVHTVQLPTYSRGSGQTAEQHGKVNSGRQL